MESEDQSKTHTSGHENHAVHVCHQCGWPFPNPHPSARHRRAHKRICGTIEGYKLVDSEGSRHSNLSDDEHLSDEDNKIHRIVSNRSEDDVFSDAAAEFLDGGSGAGSDERLANVREPVADVQNILKNEADTIQSSKNDPNADSRMEDSSPLLHVDKYGLTNVPSGSEIQKEASDENEKTNSIDDVANSSLTSVGQQADANGRKETDLDSNLLDDMISTSKIPEETTEAAPKLEETVQIISEPVPALPADGVLQSQEDYSEGFHVNIPQSDHPLEVESIEHVKASDDNVETKVDTTEVVKFVNSGETTVGVPKLEETVKMTSESLPADGVLQSQEHHSEGFNVKIPQSGLPLDVESVEHGNVTGDTIETKLDATEKIKFVNSGDLIKTYNRKEEGNVNVDVLSVPGDIHTVDHPEIMLEDFKDHNGVKLSQSAILESSEPIKDKEDYVKNPVSEENFLALGSTQLSGGDVSSSDKHVLDDSIQSDLGSSIPMVREVAHEEEANLSQMKVKISESKKPDEIGVPAVVVTAEGDKNSSVCSPEEESYVNQGTKEDDCMDPKTTPESPRNLSEIEVIPATNVQEGDDVDSKGEIGKDDITRDFGKHLKAETGDDSSSRLKEENLQEVHDAGNKGNGEIEKDDETGVAGYDAAAHVKAENRFDKNGEPEEESEHPIITPESTSKISELQVNPESDLCEDDDANVQEKGKIKKLVEEQPQTAGDLLETQTVAEDVKDESLEKLPEMGSTDKGIASDSTKVGTDTVSVTQLVSDSQLGKIEHKLDGNDKAQEDFVVVSGAAQSDGGVDATPSLKASEDHATKEHPSSLGAKSSVGDKGISSDSTKVGTDTVSGTQLGKIEHKLDANNKAQEDFVVASGAALSDGGVDATPSQKASEDHITKEQHPSNFGAKSSVGDNRARGFSGDASGLCSQPLQEESEKKQLGPSAIDVSVDSSSQSDSLEANWGSVSVLSTQSDAQAIIDAEALPPTGSQGTREKINSKQPKAASGGEHSDKSDMFEPPSFMTLVESRGVSDEMATDSEIHLIHNPQQSNQSSLQAGWFPSLTNVVNESQGRKKNEEIIAKVTNWSTGKQHTPLKNLLSEASQEHKAKSPNPKENLAPSGPVATTVNSILDPQSPTSKIASRETRKEWDSPARYHSDIKREKRKAKGRPSWVQFVCCSSVN